MANYKTMVALNMYKRSILQLFLCTFVWNATILPQKV